MRAWSGLFDEEDVVPRANELADLVVPAGERTSIRPVASADCRLFERCGHRRRHVVSAAGNPHSAVLFRAMMPMSRPTVPDVAGNRLLLVGGHSDPIIPVTNVRQLAGVLQ